MRLLLDGEWFEPVSSAGMYEHDFEVMLCQQAGMLFPEYHLAPFKIGVETQYERRIPDLALIDRQYRHWWVVEVELAHHSLNGHVLPQLEVFAQGQYGAEHEQYLLQNAPGLSAGSLRELLKNSQPGVLVLVNRDVPEWVEPVNRLGGQVMVVQVFRSDRNRHILRVDGETPAALSSEVVSVCRPDPLLPSFLQVDSPASLGIALGERVPIFLDGELTEWERLDSANQVWLTPVRNSPFHGGREIRILRSKDGRLYFHTT